MRDPEKIGEIIRAMKNTTDAPVTVKLRSGWDSGSLNYMQSAQAAAEGGAALITLHPRTRSQLFGGKAHWNHIRDLKKALDIPVIGSGDLFSGPDVRSMFRETGCDGVMLARGALGNPFIFREILDLSSNGSSAAVYPPDIRLRTALKQLRLAVRIKGENKACKEMRKHMCAYSKGFPASAALRNRLVRAGSLSEYEQIISEYLEHHGKHRT
jgi:nifR3 family TIM-barrel protein